LTIERFIEGQERRRTRRLTVVAQDPSIRYRDSFLTAVAEIPFEPMLAGPRGARFHVVDYSTVTSRVGPPSFLSDGPPEADPVAIAAKTGTFGAAARAERLRRGRSDVGRLRVRSRSARSVGGGRSPALPRPGRLRRRPSVLRPELPLHPLWLVRRPGPPVGPCSHVPRPRHRRARNHTCGAGWPAPSFHRTGAARPGSLPRGVSRTSWRFCRFSPSPMFPSGCSTSQATQSGCLRRRCPRRRSRRGRSSASPKSSGAPTRGTVVTRFAARSSCPRDRRGGATRRSTSRTSAAKSS
jgi:hypothetical protein